MRSASEPPLMRCSSKPADLAALLSEYYQSPPVRRCMIEFLRGTDLETTAVYISGHDGCSEFAEIASPLKLPDCLEAGLEIDRSLWDRDSLLAHIDLEAHNFDNPASAWLDPERALRLQQPVLDATLRILGAHRHLPLDPFEWTRLSFGLDRQPRFGSVSPSGRSGLCSGQSSGKICAAVLSRRIERRSRNGTGFCGAWPGDGISVAPISCLGRNQRAAFRFSRWPSR